MIHEKTQIRNGVPDSPKFHFHCVRLDQIKSVTPIAIADAPVKEQPIHADAKNKTVDTDAKKLSNDTNTKEQRLNTYTKEQDIDTDTKRQLVIRQTMDAYTKQRESLFRNLDYVWGVSFEGTKTKVSLTLHVNEQYEDFILNRLEREGKNGTVTRLADNTFLYEKIVFDANEMFPWLRTFIGRILDIHFHTINQDGMETTENITLRKRFFDDIEKLYRLYQI